MSTVAFIAACIWIALSGVITIRSTAQVGGDMDSFLAVVGMSLWIGSGMAIHAWWVGL